MKRVSKQMSMKITGGHTAVAWKHDNCYASRDGVAGWELYCPKSKHTLVHIYNGPAHDVRYGTGRTYICPRNKCNAL